MLKIGDFSKLSMLTVKALRFYEKEGLLIPASVDPWTGYRFYETAQLETASRIKAYRQLGLSTKEIRAVLGGEDARAILSQKAQILKEQQKEIDIRLSIIQHILEDKDMKYQVIEKEIPATIVYYAETRLQRIEDKMQFIPEVGAECMKLNPGLKCAEPPYEFCEYLDDEFKDEEVMIRHCEAVVEFGRENDRIKFKELPAAKVLSIFHKGSYEQLGEAYAFIMKYAEENGYKVAGRARESYIDGIWNKESPEDWLTEIQLPIE
ncbi:MAG: MerR family transcriptional regulator [Lachnospiraceae bacterium]